MDKPNVFRSSNFHMDAGDVLHMLFLDETGVTVDVDLWSSETTTETIPDAPTALDASDITDSSFTANWYFNENSTGYYLDVATDSAFTAMVAGYNNLSVGNVNSYSVIGLSEGSGYYFRIRAINVAGTSSNSNIKNLITEFTVITDIDGNVYTPIIIGTQAWLVENLKTTTYIDGVAIPNLSLNADWIAEDGTPGHDGAYCWYDNNIANKALHGALYNWYAIDNVHGLGIAGWRIPSDVDFSVLDAFLGGNLISGGRLKEVGTTHWDSPNTGATDEYGFRAVGSGSRYIDGIFESIGQHERHWTSDLSVAWGESYNSANLIHFTNIAHIRSGRSVRLMRDL